ncbi:MAG: UvrD-helicase domain-containing protein [Holosporaceae bacterium]|jgi:ATP-dependent helicase/nuclease subunit A|nr:UvrD-helicase domain-containing protein [Holosporaceae bacterium]
MDKIKDISASLWISASAGTGKTKSLIDRILALLLRGINPSRILCLTYTKAAASEMLMRLSEDLKKLNKMSPDELKLKLSTLGLSESATGLARSLYEKSLENNWVSIQTIHSFCWELLERFPLETGLFPGIKICDGQKWEELLNESINQAMADEKYHYNWKVIAKYTTDIFKILKDNAMALQRFIDQSGNFQKLYLDFFNLNADWIDLDDEKINDLLFARLFQNNHREIFADCAKILSSGGEDDKKAAKILQENAVRPTEKFVYAFLTQKGTKRKNLCTKKIKVPGFRERMQDIASKALDFLDTKKQIAFAKGNIAFFEVVEKIISNFRGLKIANHYLDFNDTILLTLELLRNIDWVMYKIDGGVDHVLVDEAQDTSPEQWEVIKKITGEFFSNYQSDKTVFVVGDKKQAIYSFQGTDVKLFDKTHDYFKKISQECGQHFYDEPLNKSYRTTGNILSFVDEVFAEKFPNISHATNRDPHSGVVEIVDVFEDEAGDEAEDEENNIKGPSAGEKMSLYIANFIKKTIASEVWVESKERSAKAEDFLILFQRRDIKTMRHIIEALKRENIPVTEIDKIILSDELIVEDLIALAEFSIFPLDDLMCARVLKSPIVGMSEEDLMRVCLERKDDNLWHYIQTTEYFPEKLQNYVSHALELSAFDFFMYVLTDGMREKFVGRLGEKCLDVLNEFLEMVMNYEKDNVPSLQSFLKWFRSFEHEIKREPFADRNAVRLMTAHSSKGLQSPFVILADSNFVKNKGDKILKTEDGLLLWDFSANARPLKIAALCSDSRSEDLEERYRLLYVAMTRAEDFLYILGEKHERKLDENCWYNFVSRKLDKLVRIESEGLYRRGNYKTKKLDGAASEKGDSCSSEIPHWFYEKVPLPDDDHSRQETKNSQMTYGDCVHMLLHEMPPYVGHCMCDEVADQLMRNFDLSDTEKMKAKIEALEVIKKFGFLFEADSLAEIPFVYDGKEGRIDKIAFRNTELWIVDFKTGIPKDVIPKNYLQQLAHYKRAVREITKNSNIKTAILWTKDRNLVEIDLS